MPESINIPECKLSWNGKSAAALQGQVSMIVFEDFEHGRADSIELTFQDVNKIWQGDWYPTRGDIIKLEMGYQHQALLDCGTFEVDDIYLEMPPDRLTVRARSAFASKALKQANTVNYNNTSLREVCATIAGRHGLGFEFEGENVKFDYIAQYRESDMAFLKRMAELCGFILKITDKKLVLYGLEIIEERGEVATLERADINRISIVETSTNEIKAARSVSYHAWKNKVMETTEKSKNKPIAPDEQRIYERLENTAQAMRFSKAGMRASDFRRTIGYITARRGNNILIAGVNIRLKGYKSYDGLYFIESARHIMTGSAHYETEITVRKVAS